MAENEKHLIRGAEHRRVYEETIRGLSLSVKIHLAQTSGDDELCAICLDPNPEVIRAAIQNSSFGPRHAQLVAKYHHSGAGLEYLTGFPAFVSDTAVKSGLFKNSFSTEVALRRCFSTLSLFLLNNLSEGRESTEKTTKLARLFLREKFDNSSAEQCADFIIRTEGRCLKYLIGLRIKHETAKILSRHTFTSLLLVRNLLVFPGLPPEVLRGMTKSIFVWNHPEFKKRVLGHQNCPADIKRKNI